MIIIQIFFCKGSIILKNVSKLITLYPLWCFLLYTKFAKNKQNLTNYGIKIAYRCFLVYFKCLKLCVLSNKVMLNKNDVNSMNYGKFLYHIDKSSPKPI